MKNKVLERIGNINPNQNLGQHFLVDEDIVNLLGQQVIPGNTVIEIGAGVGQLTEVLAKKAGKVIAVEIDKRYRNILKKIEKGNKNTEVIFDDVLKIQLRSYITKGKTQIVSNLPYHITEPFLHILSELKIVNATLVVGERLGKAVTSNEENLEFGKLALFVQTFFDVELLGKVEKNKSYPVPRTNSCVIKLTPKKEFKNKRSFLLKRLFITSKRNPLVKNALKEGIIEFEGTTQNQAREEIREMKISEEILNKSFEQLNNSELRIFSEKLKI